MTSRENGWYWVLPEDLHTSVHLGPWEVAHWNTNHWSLAATEDEFKDDFFEEIGERVERQS